MKARRLDWVDRLAGVDTLDEDPWLEGWNMTPQGQWLTWPWWRRLLDWVLVRTWWRLYALGAFVPYAIRYWRLLGTEQNGYCYLRFGEWMDVHRGIHDIHLSYTADIPTRAGESSQ